MYTIGQTLYFVPSYNYSPYEITIRKIGRKWLHCTHLSRVIHLDVVTLTTEDASGRAYLSKEAYEEVATIQAAWHEFRKILYNSTPNNLSVDKIQQVTRVLFGEQENK